MPRYAFDVTKGARRLQAMRLALALLLLALAAPGCTPSEQPPDKAASSAKPRNKAAPNKVEPNSYACNDNMHKDLAQYNLCRGAGGSGPR